MPDPAGNRQPLPGADQESAEVLALIAGGRARTRAELVALTGLSRLTVTKRLRQLLDAQLISEAGTTNSSGGRPARLLTVNAGKAIAVGIDIGEDHTRVALTDLSLNVMAEGIGSADPGAGPESVLSWINGEISRLIGDLGRSPAEIAGIGFALPAPVDCKRGVVVGPSVMIGWDGYDIRRAVYRVHSAPVIVDNDVNLLGLAEYRLHRSTAENLLYVKVGTGIGSAIIAQGQLFRGAFGAAGDIGHIHLHTEHEPLCRCGNYGCVEAVVGGWALARDLRQLGIPAESARDVAELAQRGKPEAIQLLRQAGRALGEALAVAVSLLNPDVLVLGGVLSHAGDHLTAGVREIVYRRSLPLSTRDLQIETSAIQERAGVLGAAQIVIDHHLGTSLHPAVAAK